MWYLNRDHSFLLPPRSVRQRLHWTAAVQSTGLPQPPAPSQRGLSPGGTALQYFRPATSDLWLKLSPQQTWSTGVGFLYPPSHILGIQPLPWVRHTEKAGALMTLTPAHGMGFHSRKGCCTPPLPSTQSSYCRCHSEKSLP